MPPPQTYLEFWELESMLHKLYFAINMTNRIKLVIKDYCLG